VGTTNLYNATAIGNGAVASSSNEVRLGDANISSLYCKGAYNPGTTNPANVYVNSDGQIMRTTNHYVGESYGGGIVFYIYDGGLHGLIAATADFNTDGIRWYAGTYTHTMALSDGVGAGKANTAIIIANQGYGDGATYAARVCNEYAVTVDGITYSDWYLPSKHELNLLYLQKTVVGISVFYYWSSTESFEGIAWGQHFDSGNQNIDDKDDYTALVRAIRAF